MLLFGVQLSDVWRSGVVDMMFPLLACGAVSTLICGLFLVYMVFG